MEANDAYNGVPYTDTADAKRVCMEDNMAHNARKTKDNSVGIYSAIFNTSESTGTGTGTYNYITIN